MSELITGQFGLMSTECECGRVKRERQSFCGTCYRALPKDLQNRLYRRIGQGYEEAHAEARAILRGD